MATAAFDRQAADRHHAETKASNASMYIDHSSTKMGRAANHPKFLDLPAELRNAIYVLAIPTDSELSTTPYCERRKAAYDACVPALSHVSRQIRQETLPIFFATNTFDFDSNHGVHAYRTWNWMDTHSLHL